MAAPIRLFSITYLDGKASAIGRINEKNANEKISHAVDAASEERLGPFFSPKVYNERQAFPTCETGVFGQLKKDWPSFGLRGNAEFEWLCKECEAGSLIASRL